MSQAGLIDIESSHPQIPTSFVTNDGTAIPIANVLEILGVLVGPVGVPIETTGSGNTVTINVQLSTESAAPDILNAGMSSFDSASFNVDPSGFVTLSGSSTTEIDVDASTAPGTDPVMPLLGVIKFTGAQVAAGVVGANVIRTDSLLAHTVTIEVQRSAAIASSTLVSNGVSHFDSAAFDVDANGFVQLNGGGVAATSFDVQANTAPGTDPVVPTSLGVVTVNGAAVANHSVVLETRSRAANAYNLEIQYATSAAATDATKSGVAHFDSSQFAVDASGFVQLAGLGLAIDSIGTQTGTNPITPTGAGLVTINGAVVAAGTNPVRSDGTGANTMALEVQISQAIAAADATKIGLSNFDSASFSVAATGFVTLSTTGVGKTITGDSGGVLSPTANNWNILGLSGSKTSGSGSTLTIKSPPFSQVGANATSSLNTGEFVTAAVTRTLPASAGLADGDLFIYVCTTSNALIIQSVSAQKIRIGSLISAAAGTATSTAIGDSVTLRFNATDGFFYAVSVVGTWLIV